MSEDSPEDKTKRNLLVATSAAGAIGTIASLVPFVKSMNPSERTKAAGAPVEVDISTLAPGSMMVVEWRQKPIWILHRTPEMLQEMRNNATQLSDPDSKLGTQPAYVGADTRSIKPEIFVAIGICTHLGCSPVRITAAEAGMNGFYCPCHGSKFDVAARVLKGSPAPTNLEVPPHRYDGDTKIVVGEDTKTA